MTDIGGGAKTLWLVFVILVPFLGVFVYLIANSDEMAKRNVERARAQQQMDDQIRATAANRGPAAEIDTAKQLLESGAITQVEFDALEQKALA